MYLIYCTNQMHSISFMWILKLYLQPVAFKSGIVCFQKMVHLYWNMSEIWLQYWFIIYTLHLVGAINWVHYLKNVQNGQLYNNCPLTVHCIVTSQLYTEILLFLPCIKTAGKYIFKIFSIKLLNCSEYLEVFHH